MIHADIRGKLNPNSSSRSEDVLTSTVLGLLRYVPGLLRAFLISSRSVGLAGDKVVVGEPGTGIQVGEDVDLLFWQRLGKHGEIDAVLVEGDLRHPTRLVGIEAKYESDKSDAQRTAEEGESSDQLDEYWRGLQEHAFSGPARLGEPSIRDVQLVYLTAHLSPPVRALGDSLRALRARDTDARLAWLSWREAYHLLNGRFSSAERRVTEDLRALLRKKGLVPFMGVGALVAPRLPGAARLFSDHLSFWSSCRFTRPLPSPAFWRETT